MVLGHELPLLSHLGVRARQQGVIFGCSDGAAPYADLKHSVGALWGKEVTLEVSNSGNVLVRQATGILILLALLLVQKYKY